MAGAATQVFSREFDAVQKITEMGSRLESYPHYRLSGRSEFRLRVGDFRIIYEFDLATNEIYLITLGNRREVYRNG
jgi:mRNA-degrading endonuclease RelE of RelBE toxin-antitoxin system